MTFSKALVLYFEGLGVKAPIIFVALDEVIMCDDAKRAVDVLEFLKGFLDGASNFLLFVTTFDNHLLLDGARPNLHLHDQSIEKRTVTGSQRRIRWLVVSPLAIEKPRHVLSELNRLTSPLLSDDAIDYFLALSGGHPRSLALLKLLLERRGQRNVAQLCEDWRKSVSEFTGVVPDHVMEEVLTRGLLGVEVGIDD